jgi:arylsulfatase A-like enzyme
MSGRIPPHVNQNNKCNNIESTSGVDLRFTLLPQKMKVAGYTTAMVGKSHLGARSPANLPINRGFDSHCASDACCRWTRRI